MEDEINLIVIEYEMEKTFLIEVPKTINYTNLKENIKEKIKGNYDFDIIFRNKKYDDEEKGAVFNFTEGDRIYIENNIDKESRLSCIFHQNAKLDEADGEVNDLSGILLLCLLNYIASNINDINKINKSGIREIIKELKEGVKMTGNPQDDIRESLKQKNGNNILTYINYLQEVISTKDIWNLIDLFDKNEKKEIISFWSILSKYQEFNEIFEKDFGKIMEKSYFDYSLIGVSIYQHRRRKEFLEKLKKCENPIVRYLLHGTTIDKISLIITDDFKYTKQAFYGMGVYFSDMIDYTSFYCGEVKEGHRTNWNKIIPVGETISCVAAEVFYSRGKKKYIYNGKLKVSTLDHFPKYEELKSKYKDKMVQPNGVHFIRVEPKGGQTIKSENDEIAIKEGGFVGTEYVITEMYQILPLYGLTLKRNEFFIIWRDGNFKGQNSWTNYLKDRKMFIYKEAKMNVYFESNTEKALELIKRKKYNKIIIITSCQGNVGKRFVDVARKILGFEVVVLFYSANTNNLSWIKNYTNALYTNNEYFYRKYITNYNIKGLFDLKEEMEKNYKCSFKLNKKCLEYPLVKKAEKKDFSKLKFEKINRYFRRVMIKNKNTKKALFMEKGKVKFEGYEGNDIQQFIWYVTILDDEMTLFSNDSYLFVDEKNNMEIKGSEWMINWKYEAKDEKYLFYYKDKNNVLTLSEDKALLKKEDKNDVQLFELLDINFQI